MTFPQDRLLVSLYVPPRGRVCLGGRLAGYKPRAGGPASVRPGACSPRQVLNLRHRSAQRRQKRSAGTHD